MRRTLLVAGIALLFLTANSLHAQKKLIWQSSFSPSWQNGATSGNAYNVNGTSINCSATTTIYGNGTFEPSMGSFGAQTPTVSGSTFVVPSSISNLQITPHYENENGYTEVVLTFSALVTEVRFNIADVDKNDDGAPTSFYDRITITGSNGVNTFYPILGRYDMITDTNFLVISGNVAKVNTKPGFGGNSASDDFDQRGTVTVRFGNDIIRKVTIRYDNVPGMLGTTTPGAQAIGIGDLFFNTSTLAQNFLNFSGTRHGQNVQLAWKTQNELGTSHFDVERNTGASWQKIGTVAATGVNGGITDYAFTDANIAGALLLYRLKQVNASTDSKYSGIVRIKDNDAQLSLLSYPNPFASQVNVNFNSTIHQFATVSLFDAAGKCVRSEKREFNPGNNNFIVGGLDPLTNGLYYLEISDANGSKLGRTALLKN